MTVSDNTRHLAVADIRKLGIEVFKAGAFLDSLFDPAPSRTSQAIARSLSDLTKLLYSKAELVAALRLNAHAAGISGHVHRNTQWCENGCGRVGECWRIGSKVVVDA